MQKQSSSELLTTLEETQSAALLNKLVQSQHQILVSELAKIDKLNELISKKKEAETHKHKAKIDSYDRTIAVLQEQIRHKQKLLEEVTLLGQVECRSQP